MLILALDTTTSACSAALVREGKLVAEVTTNIPRTHSQRLMPLMDSLFREADAEPRDLHLIAVSRGPGSFTGLRIGIATAKGLGLALDLPVVGVSTLAVLAHNFSGAGLVCPALNARRDQVYTGLYRCGDGAPQPLLADQALAASELMDLLSAYDEPIWFCGDGVDIVWQAAGNLPAPRRLPLHQRLNRAAALADLALAIYAREGGTHPDQLTPLYLRESQAELQWRRKQEAGHGC
ncbi:MAG: tRNA (adenosine(37)-N6)-threonylcarbamoyltransferase complex dimerization subunit type 1 TsaB [Firmicutes bacterium]|nr:tRNA (adenosine(37)-N6)-threonylcarbamoyltransferase complex dimerization subunit type 1 TsaB [Bacillota bacterium]